MSDHPPDFAGIDSSFTGILVPEPATFALVAAALGLTVTFARRKRAFPFAHRSLIATVILLFAPADPSDAATFNANNVAELISAINSANQNTEPDTIALAAGATFTLSEANDFTNGYTGLPTISASEELAIFGNGGVIERNTASATPRFRLLNVAAGASLTLEDVTLQGGWSNSGGAIYNAGTLALSNVTVQNNFALGNRGADCRCRTSPGGPGGPGQGGGIYSSGSVHLENSMLRDNQVRGGMGGSGPGGIGRGGIGTGGGLHTFSGTATLHGSFVTGNVAQGGFGSPSSGYGGGIYIASAQVELDVFTLAHVAGNTASTNYPNIFGPFEIIADPTPFPGDYSGNGTVGPEDYNLWKANFGSTTMLAADGNGDGTVNAADYTVWRNHLGDSLGAGGGAAGYPLGASAAPLSPAVPEPSTLAFAAIGLLGLVPCARWPRGRVSPRRDSESTSLGETRPRACSAAKR